MNSLNWKEKDDARRSRHAQSSNTEEIALYLDARKRELYAHYNQNFPQSRPSGALEQKVWDEMLSVTGGNQHGQEVSQLNTGSHSGSQYGGNGNNYNYGSGNIINNYGGTINIQNNYYEDGAPVKLKQ